METQDRQRRFKVFISYSRSETHFADELVAGLEYDGQFEVSIDRQSIAEGEVWKLSLERKIADADSVVFVISPRSAKSEVCAWEVSHAKRLGKRLVPVLAVAVGNMPVPKELEVLNWVRFDSYESGEPRSFMAGLKGLVRALNLNIEWLIEHTKYLMLAQLWDEARATNRLLTGLDVAEAKAWAARLPKDAPEVTSLQQDFIKASEQQELLRISYEREQIDKIKQAQDQRELAIAQSEVQSRRMRKASLIATASGLVLLATGLGFGFKIQSQTKVLVSLEMKQASLLTDIGLKEFRNLSLKSDNAELEHKLRESTRLIEIVDSANEQGLAGLEYTCDEAVRTTSKMASQPIPDPVLVNQLDQLYYGPMLLVEYMQIVRAPAGNSKRSIESSMVSFRNGYRDAMSTGKKDKLCELAFNVAKECAAFLNSICKAGTTCKKRFPISKC